MVAFNSVNVQRQRERCGQFLLDAVTHGSSLGRAQRRRVLARPRRVPRGQVIDRRHAHHEGHRDVQSGRCPDAHQPRRQSPRRGHVQ